jgi:hypothetical protein
VTVFSVAMSLDDRRIASGVEDGAIIWDVDSKQMVFEPLVKHISSMCLSPDGKRLASWLYDRRVIIWDAETGAALSILVILAHRRHKTHSTVLCNLHCLWTRICIHIVLFGFAWTTIAVLPKSWWTFLHCSRERRDKDDAEVSATAPVHYTYHVLSFVKYGSLTRMHSPELPSIQSRD